MNGLDNKDRVVSVKDLFPVFLGLLDRDRHFTRERRYLTVSAISRHISLKLENEICTISEKLIR